jgi:predicted nucleic acid-binding Zn ribbon protein
LQVIFLAMARQAARRPTSLGWGAAQAITTVLLFMNNVSMVLYWLFPAYLVLWFCPPSSDRSSNILEERRQRRRNLILQLAGISALGFLFLMDRLPYLLVATRINGEETSGVADFLTQSWGVVRYLFPDAGSAVLGCLGLAGSVALCRSQQNRWLGFLSLGTILVTVLHCCLTKKVVYSRACGFLLPMIVIGAAYLAERAWRGGNLPRRVITLIISMAFTGVLVGKSLANRCSYFDYPAAFAKFDSVIDPQHRSVSYAVLPRSDYIWTKDLPRQWLTAQDGIGSDSHVDRLLFLVPVAMTADAVDRFHYLAPLEASDKSVLQHAQSWEGMLQSVVAGAATTPRHVGNYQVVSVPVHAEPFSATAPFPGKSPNLVVWYPDPLRVGIFGQPVMDVMRQADIPCIRRNHRFPAHLDYYNQLYSLEFVANSAKEWDKIRVVVATGLNQFGGHAVCLTAMKDH